MEPLLVYYSSESLNTQRFVTRLGMRSLRIPISPKEALPVMDENFVLISPTYAGDDGQGAVPKQIISFLNIEKNRKHLIGVIASGNRNFGKYYAYAGDVISFKCQVPCLYKFELAGTAEDVKQVKNGVRNLWLKLNMQMAEI